VGDGVGLGVGDGVDFFFFGLGGFFGDGSEPDGENDASCGGGATWIDFTADGAAVFLVPPLALPIPNAAPNATSAATTPMAATLPALIRTSYEASRNSGWCS
jgi:hypothetical protein